MCSEFRVHTPKGNRSNLLRATNGRHAISLSARGEPTSRKLDVDLLIRSDEIGHRGTNWTTFSATVDRSKRTRR